MRERSVTPRLSRRRLMLAGLGLAGLGRAAQAQAGARQPVVKAGPYRVLVDRITQNRSVVLEYPTGGNEGSGVRTQRTIQVQVAVLADAPGAGDQLTTFQIKTVTVERNGRPVELPHYGGPLESPNDPALVRAYLYVPSLPASVSEIRSIDGEIVSYDRTAPFEVEVPLDGSSPRPVEKDGITVTVREWAQDGNTARVVVWLDAPAGSLLVNNATDGSYGLALLNQDGRAAPIGAGSLLQVRANQAEIRMAYASVPGTATRLRVRLLHRVGPRRVHPFSLEHIPLSRPGKG